MRRSVLGVSRFPQKDVVQDSSVADVDRIAGSLGQTPGAGGVPAAAVYGRE